MKSNQLLGLGLAFALVAPGSLRADENEKAAYQQNLARVRAQIEATQQRLNNTAGERDKQAAKLRQVEMEISQSVRNLHSIERKAKKGQNQMARLRRQQKQQKLALAKNSRLLEQQIRSSYQLGRQAYLKLLLNQDDPARTGRMMVYYRYLNTERSARITETRGRLAAIQETRDKISLQTLKLRKLESQYSSEKSALEIVQKRRSQVLAGLDQKVRSQSESLDILRKDEKRLLNLIQEVGTYISELPAAPDMDARFGQFRGKLKLPAKGRVWANYGSPRNMGDLRWKGLFINSPEGRQVKAVFRGRVAYAGWLHGFGLLLIIEHGDGYMSLYGHNRSLLKEVGDWVETGEIVASSGDTGNPPQAGLYFEIRHNGRPRDPMNWCRAS